MSYITFKTIGEAGNLCSQIQQYASLYALSKETNRKIIFPKSSLNKGYGFKFAQLLDIPIILAQDEIFESFINLKPDDSKIIDTTLVSRMDPKLNYNIINRFDLFHYWYPKYAKDIMNWSWNKEYLDKAIELYNKIPFGNKQTVAIHVRRGDYLLPQHDHFCQLDNYYYEKALQNFLIDLEKYHFIIFSNDIEWCKENLIEGEMITFIEPGSDYIDLIIMSLCNHFIIANSSYSWWAAFKSTSLDKKIYCPKNYLKQYSPWSHVNSNYYPTEWIDINNLN